MDILNKVIQLKEQYKDTWKDENDDFWLNQFLEEVAELILSFNGKHEHSIDFELTEIASIAMNWLEKREDKD